MAGESYWTYRSAFETPTLEEAKAAGAVPASSTEAEWIKLSPGMRREIVRSKVKLALATPTGAA